MYYQMLIIYMEFSLRELKRQIVALNNERVGLSDDMENALTMVKQKIHPQTEDNVVKDILRISFVVLIF